MPASSIESPAAQSLEVNGVRLSYTVHRPQAAAGAPDHASAATPPVVLLHGWPETSHAWHGVVPVLTAQGFTAIVPDLRGLGESGRPEDGYDVRNVAEDIHQLVAALGYGQIDLVGHDVGTWVAYAYASAYPAEVRRLVVADAGLPGLGSEPGAMVSTAVNVKTWHFPFNTLPELPEALITGREEVYMRWLFARKGFHPDAVPAEDVAVYTHAYQQPGAMTAGFAYYRAIFESVRQNKESAKTKLTMPVLALAGETGVGEALHKTMEAVATNVRGEVLPGCGHYLPDEQPAEFAAKVIAFFQAEEIAPTNFAAKVIAFFQADDAAPAEKPPAAGIPGARGVDHTGLNVPDLDAAVAFFTEVLGAQLLWRIGPIGGGELMPTHYGVDPSLRVQLATLRCGPNLNVELLQYVTPEGRAASLEEPSNSDLSVGHLAFLVDDMAAAADYLAVRGVRLFAGPKRDEDGPKAGEEHRYFLTPWGSSLELVRRPAHLPYEQTTSARLFVPSPAATASEH